jgi:hypothetical protein
MPYLKTLGRQINRRLLEVERVSQNCGLSAESIQRVVLPTVTPDGQRAPSLKFGDPRVMALMLALSTFGCLINGFRSRDLRQRVAALIGNGLEQYSASQMTYDLRRLRRKGIICRVSGSQRCYLTPHGWKLARLYARLEARSFDRPYRYERTAGRTVRPTKRRTANHRYQTKPIANSGLPHPQSCLKNRLIVQFLDTTNG